MALERTGATIVRAIGAVGRAGRWDVAVQKQLDEMKQSKEGMTALPPFMTDKSSKSGLRERGSRNGPGWGAGLWRGAWSWPLWRALLPNKVSEGLMVGPRTAKTLMFLPLPVPHSPISATQHKPRRVKPSVEGNTDITKTQRPYHLPATQLS